MPVRKFLYFISCTLVVSCNLPFDAQLQLGPNANRPRVVAVPIPELARWENQMREYGTKTGDLILSHLDKNETDPALGNCYYDCMRVFYNIADYTGDSKWLGYVASSRIAYRDNYVIKNDGKVPGYWNFTHGLRVDFERTHADGSSQAAVLLSRNAAYAGDATPLSWTENSSLSREVAYALMAYINAQLVGEPRRARMSDLFLQALNHIDGWFLRNEEPNWGPFMFGLTAEALIHYWEHVEKDARILEKVKFGADEIWKRAWIAEDEAFFYRAEESPERGAPDLNLVIAPVYSWLYLQTGDVKYRDRGDQIFAGGVKKAYLASGKHFNQNYRWSFDYVRWRKEVEKK